MSRPTAEADGAAGAELCSVHPYIGNSAHTFDGGSAVAALDRPDQQWVDRARCKARVVNKTLYCGASTVAALDAITTKYDRKQLDVLGQEVGDTPGGLLT